MTTDYHDFLILRARFALRAQGISQVEIERSLCRQKSSHPDPRLIHFSCRDPSRPRLPTTTLPEPRQTL